MYRLFISILLSGLILGVSSAKASVHADFKVSKLKVAIRENIKFESVSSSTASGSLKLEWNFGDGSQSENEIQVKHHFLRAGTYIVSLRVEDSVNEVSKKSITIEVQNNEAPFVDFRMDKNDVSSGEKISFLSKATDSDGKITSYIWKLDGTVIGTGHRLFYVFKSDGRYVLSLTVIDNQGAESTVEKNINVRAHNQLPRVHLKIERDKLVIGQKAWFYAEAEDADGTIQEILWKFDDLGDFLPGTAKVQHAFGQEGYYKIWVKAIDDRGGEAIVSETVYVDNLATPPTGKLVVKSRVVETEKETIFSILIAGLKREVERVDWDFGDGVVQSVVGFQPNISHVYNAPGVYNVNAIVVPFKGGSYSFSEKVSVFSPHRNLMTAPNQIVIYPGAYIELIPNTTYTLWFAAYDVSGGYISCASSCPWTISNSNVSIISSGSNYVTIYANSAGSSKIKVNVNGVDSYEIDVVVVPYTNNLAAAMLGEYFDSPLSNLLVSVNRSGTFDFKLSYSLNPRRTTWGDYLYFEFPISKSSVDIAATKIDQSESYSVSKTGLKRFAGRNEFLYLPSEGTGAIPIFFNDDRVIKYNNDFSISFWKTSDGATNFIFYGDYDTYINKSSINVLTSAGWRSLSFPAKNSENWANIAITYKHSTRLLQAYYDGHYVGSVVIPDAPLSGELTQMKIHKINGNSSSIDELRFWNKELTASQVKDELFTPVSLPSADLLASFSFDSGSQVIQNDDNGGVWSLNLSATNVPGAKSNQILPEKIGEIDTLISKDQAYALELPVDQGKVSVNISANTFSADQWFEASVEKCVGVCATSPDIIRKNRLSSAIHVSPFSMVNIPIELRLPFDSQSRLISDPSQIKIGRSALSITGQVISEVYEPNEVNMELGYASFQIYKGGTYWVMLPEGFSAVTYTNSDLRKNFISYWGSRSYFVKIPTNENQYQLNSNSSASIEAVICNGVISCYDGGSPTCADSFPITLGGLTLGTNYCQVNYRYYSNPIELGYVDLFVIQKY